MTSYSCCVCIGRWTFALLFAAHYARMPIISQLPHCPGLLWPQADATAESDSLGLNLLKSKAKAVAAGTNTTSAKINARSVIDDKGIKGKNSTNAVRGCWQGAGLCGVEVSSTLHAV